MTELHSFSSDFIKYQVNPSVTEMLDFLLPFFVNAQYLLLMDIYRTHFCLKKEGQAFLLLSIFNLHESS